MSIKLCLLLLVVSTYTDATSNISQMPQPLIGFKDSAALGQWFTIFRSPVCSKSRSKEYPNLKTIYTRMSHNTLIMRTDWGTKGYCNTIFAKKENVSPSVYVVREGFGDLIGGRIVVVGTDYKRFLVSWICSKLSVFGECQNPTVSVVTRTPTPNSKTIANVNYILMKVWGMTVNDLRQVVHTGFCFGSSMKKPFYK